LTVIIKGKKIKSRARTIPWVWSIPPFTKNIPPTFVFPFPQCGCRLALANRFRYISQNMCQRRSESISHHKTPRRSLDKGDEELGVVHMSQGFKHLTLSQNGGPCLSNTVIPQKTTLCQNDP
jgi:hypothetical protein